MKKKSRKPRAYRNTSVPKETHDKLLQIGKERGWGIGTMITIWADRELALIQQEQQNVHTPPGRSGEPGVSSPPLHVSPKTAGALTPSDPDAAIWSPQHQAPKS